MLDRSRKPASFPMVKSLLFILLLSAMSAAGSGAESHPVRARLLADEEGVVPGEPFRVGVELRMEEGWHTYWRFSGDAGMPTAVDWVLPEGFAAGQLGWPLPHKYEEAGGLIAYGYADETVLLADVVPPAGLAAGDTVCIRAEVSWLVCREVCIPGDTSLVLELPVLQERGEDAHRDVLDEYASRVPGMLGNAVELDYGVRRADGEVVVDLVLGDGLETEEGVPDFYPLEGDFLEFRSALAGRNPLRLELRLRPLGKESVETLKGVLVYQREGDAGRRGGEVELVLKGKGPLDVAGDGLLDREFEGIGGEREGRSLAVYLLLAAVGGLILNLMPCVLPVISLKVLGFVSQAGEERGRVRQLGLVFCAGIVATFLVLAGAVILLKQGGEQIGWGFQFQHPGFVMGMAALVFALGLSLFGVFTVNFTGGGLGGLGGGEGLAGSFFNGVLATILATPCTAPFLGTALGFAFAQTAGVIGAVFAAIGLGMALPYALLALQPGWMRFLPKPGDWMERFKQLMGFLLMGTVLWLLWVLGKQVGVEGVIWTGAFLLCVGLACWLVGQWIDLRSSRRRRMVVRGLGLAILLGGYWIFLDPVLEVEQSLETSGDVEESGLVWEPFSVARVEQLLAAGERHVFIDFTAEWCWTCKVNERTVLAGDAVGQRFEALGVALIKADWTNRNPEITELLHRFGRSGVPLYVIFPAGRPDRPLVLPEVITSGVVLGKLDEAEVLSQGGE